MLRKVNHINYGDIEQYEAVMVDNPAWGYDRQRQIDRVLFIPPGCASYFTGNHYYPYSNLPPVS
jgi:hypothetical protein